MLQKGWKEDFLALRREDLSTIDNATLKLMFDNWFTDIMQMTGFKFGVCKSGVKEVMWAALMNDVREYHDLSFHHLELEWYTKLQKRTAKHLGLEMKISYKKRIKR